MTDALAFSRLDLRALTRDVGSGRRSAVEVAGEALARIAAYDEVQPSVWITRVCAEEVLEAAARVDRRIAAGEALPLAGAPFAVKDNMDVAGLATTAGCPAFAYRPDESAEVVRRLEAAGAVLMGKTNLDQFATGLVGSRSPYGPCSSVYNLDYISGGSSSGSAVAVAAGLLAFALGTDTAGSGRVPAALNHLLGFKPTKGRWSARGVVPACQSLDCVTVFTSTAEEALQVDDVLAAFDPEDPYGRAEPGPHKGPLEDGFSVGTPRAADLEWFGDRQSPALFEKAKERAAAMGASLVEVDIRPLLEAADLLYQGPWVAERTEVVEDLLHRRPGAVHPVVRGILSGGFSLSAVETFRGLHRLAGYQRRAEELWKLVDVLLLPTAPTTYRIREVLAEPLALNANLGRYTNFVNLLDMSAVAAPAGFRTDATGFGVSFIAPAWSDRRLLDLARRYEEAAPMPEAPPLDMGGSRSAVRIAVVGAHLAAMPLHWQLTSRSARLVRRCSTAPVYRLHAMAGTAPPKPALVHVGGETGARIEVEVYELETEAFGSFVAEVPPPLAIGTVTLEGGEEVKGFVAEPRALEGARDITNFGGWRAYMQSLG